MYLLKDLPKQDGLKEGSFCCAHSSWLSPWPVGWVRLSWGRIPRWRGSCRTGCWGSEFLQPTCGQTIRLCWSLQLKKWSQLNKSLLSFFLPFLVVSLVLFSSTSMRKTFPSNPLTNLVAVTTQGRRRKVKCMNRNITTQPPVCTTYVMLLILLMFHTNQAKYTDSTSSICVCSKSSLAEIYEQFRIKRF